MGNKQSRQLHQEDFLKIMGKLRSLSILTLTLSQNLIKADELSIDEAIDALDNANKNLLIFIWFSIVVIGIIIWAVTAAADVFRKMQPDRFLGRDKDPIDSDSGSDDDLRDPNESSSSYSSTESSEESSDDKP